MKQNIKKLNLFPYLAVLGGVTLILCIIYRNANLFQPLVYAGGDELGVFYIIKSIRDHGWYLYNPDVGGFTGGEMHDYMYSDSLSFLLIKIIALFADNVYLIGNIFYFLSHVLVALSSVYVCRKLNYNSYISVAVGILFAFSPYMQLRYSHMWLTPYYTLPLACLVAIWILRGEFSYFRVKDAKNKTFMLAMIFSFASAFTGFYYAFFTCVIYGIAIAIRLVNTKIKRIKTELYPLAFIGMVGFGVVANIIPNLVYWIKKGMNPNSELNIRCLGDAETYALKLNQLLFPRTGHRIWVLEHFQAQYGANFPLVNENVTAAMGFVAVCGFLLSVVWLFRKKRLDKTYSYLNLGLFVVGTIGGVGAIFSIFVQTPMRCYNRISLMIMFISLLCVAEVFTEVSLKWKVKKYLVALATIAIIFVGVYDQTIDFVPSDEGSENLKVVENFVEHVENVTEDGTRIFQLPYVDWPSGGNYRMFRGYLESDTLKWSYGSMQGREESNWQRETAGLYEETDKMIAAVKEAGYEGIYLDKVVYNGIYGEEVTKKLCEQLTEELSYEPIISEDEELCFWQIRN